MPYRPVEEVEASEEYRLLEEERDDQYSRNGVKRSRLSLPFLHSVALGFLIIIMLLIGNLSGSVLSSAYHSTSFLQAADQLVVGAEGSRIGLVTVKYGTGTRFSRSFEQDPFMRAIAVNGEYSKKWGYSMWFSRQNFLTGPQRHHQTALYTKQGVLLSVILDELRKPEEKRLEWIFFFDADALIINHNVPLETFLPPQTEFGRSQFLICSRDPWGVVNSGVYGIKVSELSIKFLTALIALPTVIDSDGNYGGGEQTAMYKAIALDSFSANVSIVPSFWFNADSFALFNPHFKNSRWVEVYKYGDFMIHFMSAEKAMMHEMLEALERGANTTLAPSLETTRYINGNETVAQWYKTAAALPLQERIRLAKTESTGKTFYARSD